MSQDLVLSLQKQNRLLKAALGLGALVLTVVVGVAATEAKTRFTEIEVERINVVGADGKRQLVIASRERLPRAVVDGKEVKEDRGMPGLIFFNETGDECGGLIWKGQLDAKGKAQSGMHFSMDRFGGDQQLALGHYEGNGTMETGLNVYDSGLAREIDALREAVAKAPAGPEKDEARKKLRESGLLQTPRVFVGKTRGKSSAVILSDSQGRPRIMMLVTPEGQPRLQFMDEKGAVTQSFPQAEK
ncbi:MAG: hypothetical protein BWY56_02341 [Acidobacteria bacterium ADurb.Bin340]|nr:MAG: hypothetical protein BWY56_02341 [Acidobacteria bacterium ADurb.Bin340]